VLRGVPRPSRLLAAPFVESWFYKLQNRVSRKLQRSREEPDRVDWAAEVVGKYLISPVDSK
jgi:hypothetical protein